MHYRIFPAIGIARLGEDPNFILAPERPGDTAGELEANGTLSAVRNYKDPTKTRIRKTGARFHLFESNDGNSWSPANLPPTATVTWSVSLINKKSAVIRPLSPPTAPVRPQVNPANASQVIDGGTAQISGPNASSDRMVGQFKTTGADGAAYQVDVELGQLKTDGKGRLIVMGGKGFSSAPPNTPLGSSFYHNPNWHDDVSDGPVTAEIRLSAGDAPIVAENGAWVVVAPPDYAPDIDCPVTLYDVIRQVGITSLGGTAVGVPSFDLDIAPIIERVKRLQWVHADATWSDPRFADPNLRSKALSEKPLRKDVRDLVLYTESVFRGHINAAGPKYRFRDFQKKILDDWVAGTFDNTPVAIPAAPTAAGLTRAALETAAGQGFCPGIEAGIIVLDQTIYATPFDFRIKHGAISAGDLTALMAQPWQADFLKCNTDWWPTQRPDLARQSNGALSDWVRGANSHAELVEKSARLGFVVRQAPDELFLEVERDPLL